jgi:PAS domain S-box-containing protein
MIPMACWRRLKYSTSVMIESREVAELRAALKEAQDLVSIAPAFFGFVSTDGIVLSVNDRFLDVIRSGRDRVVGQVLWEAPCWNRLPSSAKAVREAIVLALQGESRQLDLEYRAVDEKRDELRWMTLAIMPIRDADGEVSRIGATGIDITDRKMAQQEALAVRGQLEVLLMQAHVPMVILLGPEHRFCLANPLYEKLVGRPVIGKTVREAFTQGEIGSFIPLLDGVYRTGEPRIGREALFELPGADGTIQKYWLNFGYHPFRDFRGDIQGILAIVEDVTEVVRARLQIERSERDLRVFVEAMPQMAFIADPSGSVTYFNQRWYEYVRMEGTEGWGWKDKPIHHFDDLQRTVLRWKEAVRTGRDYEIEYRLRRHDGEYRWHLGRAVAVRDGEGKVTRWIGTNTDIHDQRILLEKLQDERDLRERFVSTLTHDLRTPMTAARMSAQLVAKKYDEPQVVQKIAGRIAMSMDRADGMIRDLLDANRISAGEALPIEVVPCNLNQIVSEAIEELSTIHGDRFVLRAPERIQGFWSRNEISRLIENLAGNAVKYGASNRPVTIRLSPKNDEVLIEVHNEGPPIPLSEQANLFEPFRRSRSALTGAQTGWGLGLTLVKGIAEAHAGTAGVRSSLPDGTTFWVRLPVDARRGKGLMQRPSGYRG